MKDERLYLHHMLDAADKIEQYIRDGSYEEFMKKRLLYDGMMMELAVIGEMSVSVSEDMQKKITALPWEQMRGLRNRIVHEYHGLDDKALWQVCTEDLPVLQESLRAFFKKYGSLDS